MCDIGATKPESRSNADLVYSTGQPCCIGARNSPRPTVVVVAVAVRRLPAQAGHLAPPSSAALYCFMVCFGSRLILLTPPSPILKATERGPVRLITDREKDDYGTGRPPVPWRNGAKNCSRNCAFFVLTKSRSTRPFIDRIICLVFLGKTNHQTESRSQEDG